MDCRVALGRLAQRLERLVHTEEVGGSNPPSPTIPPAANGSLKTENHRAEVAKRQTRCVQGAVSIKDVWVQIPPSAPFFQRALVAQWIERCPAEAEVVSSNLAKRAISMPCRTDTDTTRAVSSAG